MEEVISVLPQQLSTCTSLIGDIKRISDWSVGFQQPWDTIYGHFKSKYDDIIHSLDLLNYFLSINDQKSAGESVAKVLIHIFGPI